MTHALAIDFDGTIADTNGRKVAWVRDNLGIEITVGQADATSCVPIIGRDEYTRMGQDVFSPEGTMVTEPTPGALDALRRLAEAHRLVLLSARGSDWLPAAEAWLVERGVRDLFADVRSSSGTTKAGVVESVGAHALVDDDTRHLVIPSDHPFLRYHFHPDEATPWRVDGDVVHVRGWTEFDDHLAGALPALT
ncbi:hypothetical protein HN371_09295 [Candidatus Poribacteria bacterium]|jgi:hypothetical protein|nr:hypothetical protein [Candidatus Poribacteria bacterium]MBT5534360.1 hypothetical protein [Candidatus Poribacteria bacterium]MBT5710341.1 hypothetical protein [Candidatus Poribacteria bacterium]MBT7101348.1 hypothetical protein [Candidatus Poribacteria bacterium]MBT7804754.1 hypothetical protein [Candidatus Poribacteria bacterium]